jgi:ADP-heptose:LPS heptosyltransferase
MILRCIHLKCKEVIDRAEREDYKIFAFWRKKEIETLDSLAHGKPNVVNMAGKSNFSRS